MSSVHVLSHPLAQVRLGTLRDRFSSTRQFRDSLAELSVLLACEVTRSLETREVSVSTPLTDCAAGALSRPVVLGVILRAALGMKEGFMRLLPEARVAHIGLQRNEQTHEPDTYYFKAPGGLADSDVILLDPMLATGGSSSAAVSRLKERGAQRLSFVCVLACPPGIERLQRDHPDVPIFTAAVDPVLNDNAYIVPGLGDAGDRYFGTEDQLA
jgi:uracil phosphoribosyltransferase